MFNLKSSCPLRRWGILSLIYSVIFLIILGMAYTGNLPSQLGIIPYYDKIGHIVLYAIAAYLGHRLLRYHQLSLGKWGMPLFPALFGMFTLSEELIQGFSPHRTFDGYDLIFSFVGIGLGYWLAMRSRPS